MIKCSTKNAFTAMCVSVEMEATRRLFFSLSGSLSFLSVFQTSAIHMSSKSHPWDRTAPGIRPWRATF